jgi:hypothetical protein
MVIFTKGSIQTGIEKVLDCSAREINLRYVKGANELYHVEKEQAPSELVKAAHFQYIGTPSEIAREIGIYLTNIAPENIKFKKGELGNLWALFFEGYSRSDFPSFWEHKSFGKARDLPQTIEEAFESSPFTQEVRAVMSDPQVNPNYQVYVLTNSRLDLVHECELKVAGTLTDVNQYLGNLPVYKKGTPDVQPRTIRVIKPNMNAGNFAVLAK